MVNRAAIEAEMWKRFRRRDENQNDEATAQQSASTPTAYERWNAFLMGDGANDNDVTRKVRSWLQPDKQAEFGNALGVKNRNLSNPYLNPSAHMIRNPYAPGSLQSDMYEAGRTGEASFKLLSGVEQMGNWDAFVRLGLNDANVAEVARQDAQLKLLNAHARGVEDAPKRYDSYIDRNAGKGYKAFGGNAGDVHKYGLAYENVLAAEATKINRKEGRKDDVETIKAGDYASLSDGYIDEMIAKTEEHVAQLMAQEKLYVMNPSAVDHQAIKGELMTAQTVLASLQQEKQDRSAMAAYVEEYAQGSNAPDWGSMVDVDEKGTDIVDKMLYMNLVSQQRGNWDDDDNEWYRSIGAEMGGSIPSYNDYSSEGYHLMTADEIALVNKVWNTTHDPIKTQEVLDAMASTLRSRRMNFDEDLWAYRADAYGDLMVDLASIPMQTYADFEGAVNAFQGVLGNEDVKDITSGEWRTQNSVNAIRGWTGDKAYNSGGWLGKIAHDWGLAAGDEMMRFLPSLVFGPGAQKLMSRIAGMNQGAYGAYGRGVDNSWQGLLEGAAFGQIEAMTENLGLDVPSTSATRPSKHLFKQIAAEAGEEMASEALGQIAGEAIADWTGTTSANDQAYMDALMASDEKDRLKRHQEAQAAVAEQNLQDIGYSGLMGGLVGATLSGPSAMSLSRHQRRTGKMISSNNNANALLNVGMSMDEGSEARQMAEAFSAQAKKGKKMSNGQLGRLYAATAKDLDAQSAAVVTETMNDVIAEEMVNKGASEETAKAAAPILSKQLRGEELTEADRRVLRQSKAATTMLEELNRITEGGKDGEAVAVEWADKAVGDAMAKGQSLAEKGIQLGSTLRPTASTAIAKSAKKAKTLTSETATETGVRNTAATPLGSKEAVDIQRVEADKNGVLKLHVKAADGTEKNMSYQQLSFQSESTGHVITHAIDNAGGNAELANLMVHGYTGGDSTEYLAQFDAAYRAGYDGTALNADNMTRFGKGISKEAFKLGQKQAQEAEQTRLKNIGKGMTGNGSVAIPDGVDVNRLSKPQRRQVAVVRTIAKATGINFTFYQSAADDSGLYRAENGSYDAATNSIRIDLNAGKNYKGDVAEYAILRTAAHEMTHFIEANSRENYAKMRQYIADEFARKGIDFNTRVQEKIDRSPVPLTRGGAIAEVIADGCEMMLQDSQAVQRLLQKDESLAGQIKQVLSDFADRIRKAFDGIRPGSKDAEALLEERDGLLHYADELVNLWDEGLVEAVENVQNTEAAPAGIPHVQQFELRSTVEQRNDGLIAVHNISSNKLMDTLELGAFPMPSIAVVKAKQGHDSFGEYSVVFAPDTIDPKKNKANRVYGNDAWTPVFPEVEREVNSKELYRAADEVESAAGKIAEAYERDARSFFNRFAYQDETHHSDGDIQEYAWNNDGMVAAYASENGTAVEILQHDVPVNRGYNIARADQYDKILDIISAEDIGRLSGKDIFNTYGDQLAEVGRIFFNAVEAWKMGDRREAVRGLEIIKQAKAYEDAGRDAKPLTRREDDYAGTARAVRDSIDRASFNDWVMEKMSGILGQKGIRNDKDRFTPSGSRRSFNALHDAYTAENVVRAMLRQDESSISASDARGLKAAASSMYSSLDDIRADADRLRQVSEAEYDAILAKADNELRDFFNAIEAWDYDMQEEAGNLLVKAAKRNMVPAQMAKLFRQNGFSKATEENAEIGRKVLDQLQKIPTGYFEAKPARVVSFDEVRMVVAPDTMPVKLADALNEHGIPYTTYDGTASDRKAKLNAVEWVQFSPREIGKSNADEFTKEDGIKALEYCYQLYRARNMTENGMYIPLLGHLPKPFLELIGAGDYPVIMQVDKGIQAVAPETYKINKSHGHNLTPRAIMNVLTALDENTYVGVRDDGRFGIAEELPDGSAMIVLADIEQNKPPHMAYGFGSGKYNVVVTLYGRESFESAVWYLDKNGYAEIEKKDDESSESSGEIPPSYANTSTYSISEKKQIGNTELQFSLRTPAPATTRDYLLSLPDADLTTEGQKDAMRRYRAYVDELRGLEEQRATQEELAQTTTGDAQLAAKARAGNLTKQADRLRDKLHGMENSNVFRPLAAEARAVLEANRQLDIGKPVETVIKGMGGKVRNAEEKLIRFRQQVQEDRNTREKITATRKRITKMVKYLDTLRRKESDYKHVPEELKPTVNALVAAFAEHSSMVFDSRRAERIAQAYSKLQALDNDLAAFYDPDIQEKIEYIAALMELKRGKPMKLAEVEIIEDVVGSIYTMVRGSNDAFIDDQKADFEHIAQNVADEMLARQDKTYRVGSKLEDGLNTLIVSGNLTPVYYFDNLGNAMLKRLGYDIMNGQDKYGLYQRDDRNTMGEIRRKYHYNDWKNDKPIVHNDVQFTKEQVLWVYATAKREATNELAQTHHLDEGGIVFEGGEVVGADGKKRKVTTPMRLSAKDVQAITSTLTEEQKGYADAVVRHMSTTVGDRGNEVSMRMYGFRKYREQYYFPYKTAGDQRHQTSVSNAVSATNDARLVHQAFSNPLKKGANTPLVIGDFTEMATSHMNAMNTYAAMVVPVENMNRVLNRKTDVDGATTTIRALMAQKYGDPTKTYLETLLKDLNGGAQVDNRTGGWIDKTVGLYKKGAVVASASVVLQQWTSIFRAAYMVNPKYFLTSTFQKRDWDELVKYSGVATIKAMGRFDVSVGVGGSNWLAADADDFTLWEKARQMMKPTDWDTFKTRWDDAINFLPGYADQITWAHIWNAVKAEQAEQNPGMDTSSDAFLKQCAERFNDVINHTQVYDSTMTRSQLMRSKNALDKMMTAFGAEPTMIINMAYDAMHNPSHKGRRGRMIASAIATISLSQLFAAAMQALASAWRKDDDERKALEKFIDKWSYNFADNMNPFTLFPYVRDIWDTLFSKYEVERSDMALFSELKNAISKWNNDSYSPYRKVEEIAGTVAKFLGLPLKNVMRDLRSLYNAINSDWSSPSPASLGYTVLDNIPLRANNAKSYYQRMEKAYASGDDDRAQEIASYLEGKGTSANSVNDQLGGMLKSMLAAGNDAGVDAILADMAERGKTRDSGDMRRIINDLYKNGDISWEQAERLYKKHTTLTDANDLYWHKAELDYKGEGNYSAYRAAREALLAGDKKTYLAEKSKLLTHGKKGPNVMSETVTDLKDELLALYETNPAEARKLREMIVWAYMECGKTKQSANKIIDGWFDDK